MLVHRTFHTRGARQVLVQVLLLEQLRDTSLLTRRVKCGVSEAAAASEAQRSPTRSPQPDQKDVTRVLLGSFRSS